MLADAVKAVQHSVVFVVRAAPINGAINVGVSGTACYLGRDIFLTANHLFMNPDIRPGEMINIGWLTAGGGGMQVCPTPAVIERSLPAIDLALLRVPGFGATLPQAFVSVATEEIGRSVFSYGFPASSVQQGAAGLIFSIVPRAIPSVIGSVIDGKYQLDAHTYPGESGSPVFRCSDHALVGIVQASRGMLVPDPNDQTRTKTMQIRGPTLAGRTASIASELAQAGVDVLGSGTVY
jgi:hypothetical protein